MNMIETSDQRRFLEVYRRRSNIRGAVFAFGDEVRSQPFRVYISAVAALTIIYYLLLASPLYVSETQIEVRSKQAVAAVPLLAAFMGQTPTGLPDAVSLSNYIQSPDILKKLDKTNGLRALYSKFRLDLLYHMPKDASDETFLNFYNRMVSVDVDTDTNILTVDVKSFSPQSAQKIGTDIDKVSSAFVDDLDAQLRNEGVRSAQTDVASAQADLSKTDAEITKYRLAAGIMDASASSTAAGAAIVSMQSTIYTLRTQLASMMTYSTPTSPQVKQLQAQIDSLVQQMAQVQTSMVGNGDPKVLAQQLVHYEDLLTNQSYEQQRVMAAQASLDQARSLAEQRQLFVVEITKPNLPTTSTEPKSFFAILSVLLVAASVYGIGKLTLASIRDHQGS